MSDTLITIVAIFLAAILMFVFPLMSVTERNDDIAQNVVQTATSEFVNKISTTGAIKANDYETYLQKLESTGNTYSVEIEVQHIDENMSKKSTSTSQDLIGENVYWSSYTSEVINDLYKNQNEVYPLNKGDNVIVTAKNTNKTIAQSLRSFFYKITGQGIYQIAASSSSMVVNTGRTSK